MNDIIELLIKCGNEGRLLYPKEIVDIINILVDKDKLTHIKKVIINQKKFVDYYGYYNYSNGEIVINYRNLVKRAVKNYKSILTFYDLLSTFERYINYNFSILHTIFHELEHVKQRNIQDFNSLENKIVLLENSFITFDETDPIMETFSYIKRSFLYKKNYKLSPIERYADNAALSTIVSYSESFCSKAMILLNKYYHLQYLLYSYNEVNGPTEQYFSNIEKEEDYNKTISMYDTDSIDFNRKLELGLRVDNEELKEKNAILKRILK